MKNKNITIRTSIIFSALLLLLASCSDILEERPESFLSPENALTSPEGYDAAIAELHRLCRGLRTSEVIGGTETDKAITPLYASGTDIAWFVILTENYFNDYSKVNPTHGTVRQYWNLLFKIVANANSIISTVRESGLEEDDKLYIEGNARFFRAFAYRYLVYLFGDVPIIPDEIASPKFDFVRDPVQDVLAFMRDDLEYASAHLPEINPGDGRLAKAAADHVLAETYISLGEYDKAVSAASRVINDPQYALMTERFGSWTNMPGDVFWDLFRTDNQNRTSGNTESIWVWQQDFTTPNNAPKNSVTRAWAPLLERLKDSEGKQAIIPADTLGRGVSFVKPTLYLDSLIWESDFNNDIRNSKYNMQRHFVINNPASAEYGQLVVPQPSDLDRNHHVFITKAGAPEGYVQGYDSRGNLYTDIYAIRLAETYLIRAEAHLMAGEKDLAAADINEVRKRAHANPVAPANVDLDYILDERARELVVEEPRRLTLARTHTLVERVTRYNPVSEPSIQDYNNLWPIPQAEIDANIEGDLKQNPGYETN